MFNKMYPNADNYIHQATSLRDELDGCWLSVG